MRVSEAKKAEADSHLEAIKMKKFNKESFKKLTNRDNLGRFHQGVVGARLCVLLLILLALLIIYSYMAQREEPFKFVSPVVEGKEIDYKVKFLEDHKTSDMEVVNMIVDEFSDQGARVVKEALDIAFCESRFDEEAQAYNKNGSIDRGVFQINSIHKHSANTLLAAYENIRIAKKMYLKNKSWSAWSCSRILGIK